MLIIYTIYFLHAHYVYSLLMHVLYSFLFFYALNFATEFLLYMQKIAGLNPSQQTNCPD